jgi:imidazolonepropionase
MPTILTLACLQMGLTVEQALTAATLNAAAALGRASEVGSIEVGKRADLIVLDAPTYHHVVYHYGVNPVRHVVKNGEVVVRDGRRVT